MTDQPETNAPRPIVRRDSVQPVILHASDLHFGPHFLPTAGNALIASARELNPDAIVLSGDFTNRAKRKQFEDAAAFVKQLPNVPILAVPGNHDVPLYRVWERMFTPYSHFRRHLGPDTRSVELPFGHAVLLNTTHPYLRIVEGRMPTRQLDRIGDTLARTVGLRMVVVHHPLQLPSGWKYGRAIDASGSTLKAWSQAGVDLILSGHLHCSFATPTEHGALLVQAGTATTTRGRGAERHMQTFNVITVGKESIVVEVRKFEPSLGAFVPVRAEEFARRNRTSETI